MNTENHTEIHFAPQPLLQVGSAAPLPSIPQYEMEKLRLLYQIREELRGIKRAILDKG